MAGWWMSRRPPAARGRSPPDKLEEWKARATVPAGAPPTIPYFLEKPLRGDLYEWGGAPAAVRGEPFEPSPLAVVARLRIGGEPVFLAREVAFRLRDQAIGEVRRPVRAAPLLEVAVSPDLLVWPVGVPEKRLEVTLTSNAARPVSGRLEMFPPEGWPVTAPSPFSLSKAGERTYLDVVLRAPERLRPGRQAVRFLAKLEDGATADLGIRLIDYGYIPRTPLPERSEAGIAAAEIRFPPIRRLGYVRGAADRVPEALAGVGLPVEILSARELETGDLAGYDAILIGSRAYETDPILARTNGRLLDYVRNGGLLIVQYQQYPFLQGGYAPFAFEIARPHDRVTDESAASHRARSREPRLHDAQSDRAGGLERLGPGTRAVFRALLGLRVHAASFHGRPRRSGAEGRSPGRPRRKGPLRLHGPRVLPAASCRRAGGVSSAREPAGLEVLIKGGPSR